MKVKNRALSAAIVLMLICAAVCLAGCMKISMRSANITARMKDAGYTISHLAFGWSDESVAAGVGGESFCAYKEDGGVRYEAYVQFTGGREESARLTEILQRVKSEEKYAAYSIYVYEEDNIVFFADDTSMRIARGY